MPDLMPTVGRPAPFRRSGYMASRAVIADALHLAQISGETVAPLFAHLDVPVPADWFSGWICGCL